MALRTTVCRRYWCSVNEIDFDLIVSAVNEKNQREESESENVPIRLGANWADQKNNVLDRKVNRW